MSYNPVTQLSKLPPLKICACGKQFFFLPTTKGNIAPVEADSIPLDDLADLPTLTFDPKRHRNHFITCPKSAAFRKPKGQGNV